MRCALPSLSLALSLALLGFFPASVVRGRTGASSGKTVVRFAGVPGRRFEVQWTDSLEPPVSWSDGPLLTVGLNGLIEYVDNQPPSSTGRRFYRVIPSPP